MSNYEHQEDGNQWNGPFYQGLSLDEVIEVLRQNIHEDLLIEQID
jgi:hypothetical protein